MKLLDVKEIAEILNVKPSTVYQWAELRQIPSFKLNGALRFDPDDINKWIQDCKRLPQSSYNPLVQTGSPRKGVI